MEIPAGLLSFKSKMGCLDKSTSLADVIIADWMAAGDHVGYFFLIKAMTPKTSGVAIEVSLLYLVLN